MERHAEPVLALRRRLLRPPDGQGVRPHLLWDRPRRLPTAQREEVPGMGSGRRLRIRSRHQRNVEVLGVPLHSSRHPGEQQWDALLRAERPQQQHGQERHSAPGNLYSRGEMLLLPRRVPLRAGHWAQVPQRQLLVQHQCARAAQPRPWPPRKLQAVGLDPHQHLLCLLFGTLHIERRPLRVQGN